ncbi:hypothetical protein bcgnr5368_56080 [Bacillus cereus]|nr:hypothetical protein WHT_58530 [Bacillus cereus]
MFYHSILPLFLGISAGSANTIADPNLSNYLKNKTFLDVKSLLLLPTTVVM